MMSYGDYRQHSFGWRTEVQDKRTDGMYDMSTEEPEDDEVLVYDWRNAAVPRPAGTVKLLDRQSTAPEIRPTPPPAVVPNYFSGNFNGYGQYNETPYHQNQRSMSYPYNTSSEFRFSPQKRYQNFKASPTTTTWAYNQPTDRNAPGTGTSWNSYMGASQKGAEKIQSQDDDWFDIEEIDYSSSNLNPTNNDTQPQYVQSEVEDTEMHSEVESSKVMDVELPTPTSPTLSVPKSSLPLDEVLSGLPKKSKDPDISLRNSRKRQRSELEQNGGSTLEDLLSKTKHRASARSYAKPTRRVDCTVPTSKTNPNDYISDKQSEPLPRVPITSVSAQIDNDCISPLLTESESSQHSNSIQSTLEDTINSIENNSILEKSAEEIEDSEDDIENEAQLRIRTDIFEEDVDDE